MAKVFMFLAEQFETVEALTPLDVLRRAGVEVVTVSITGKEEVCSAQKVIVKADALLSDIEGQTADAYILPGGPGHVSMIGNEELSEILIKANERHETIAAICAAPAVLGKLGILNGRKATVFPGYESHLDGATVSDESVVVSDNCITAKGMGVSLEFALTLVRIIVGAAVSEKIASSIQCK